MIPGPKSDRRFPTVARAFIAAAALALVPPAAGCGFGAGEPAEGEVVLTATRDYGASEVVEATIADPQPTDTVLRILDREAEITTRYGGGFVQSIDGISGSAEDGRSFDWFFYVNGIESPIGSAEAGVEPGDRIWWDHHDWTNVMRVPAVVGSFPQPFASAFEGGGEPIEVGCAGADDACGIAAEALEVEGIEADVVELGEAEAGSQPRVLVGELDAVLEDRVAAALIEGPDRSGVFARATGGGSELELHDVTASPVGGGDNGLVAALVRGAEAPTWVVTGTEPPLVKEAAELVGAGSLAGRFAVAIDRHGVTTPLPVR
ncbi:MAG TPA: DUF4430 domain-containing protein [Solirubrobacterales bacterium]|nr:DUF4430 domain-containing protein [Solirubrobacterales bacterium]